MTAPTLPAPATPAVAGPRPQLVRALDVALGITRVAFLRGSHDKDKQ